MENNKQLLLNQVVMAPLEKRKSLHDFIETKLEKEDYEKIIFILDQKGWDHRISNLSYSEKGELSVTIETGVTFGR